VTTKLFSSTRTVESEMEMLKSIQEIEPEYATAILLQCQSLVELASLGLLDELTLMLLKRREVS